MRSSSLTSVAIGAAAMLFCVAVPARALEPEDYEEPAGPSGSFQSNPSDDVYGVAVGTGVWLRKTPVFADYFATAFWNGIEDAWYGGGGLTLRVMPHWRVSPFVGAGGSYSAALSSQSADAEMRWKDQGESYWGGHVEGGLRVWLPWRYRLLEIMGRQTWTSLSEGRDYWMVGIGLGAEP